MKKGKRAAVIPSKGIGDALLMMVASHQLLLHGYEVVTFHEKLKELQNWFSGHQFEKKENLKTSCFDLIIAQNDNSNSIADLIGSAREKLSIFYPTYHAYKHASLSKLDQVFDASLPMADNVANSIALLLGISASKDNGLRPPSDREHKRYKKRVVIHPTSSLISKNWSAHRFIKVAHLLEKKGFKIVFVVSLDEKKEWDFLPFELQAFATLDALAAFLFESEALIGNDSLLGHLASNLGLATVILADNAQLMQLWRPGWHPGVVLTPPLWVPSKIRENWWRILISPKKVANYFC